MESNAVEFLIHSLKKLGGQVIKMYAVRDGGSIAIHELHAQIPTFTGTFTAVILTGIVGGLFAFRSAYEEAHEAQDDQLRHIADLFDQDHLPAKNDSMTEPADPQ